MGSLVFDMFSAKAESDEPCEVFEETMRMEEGSYSTLLKDY